MLGLSLGVGIEACSGQSIAPYTPQVMQDAVERSPLAAAPFKAIAASARSIDPTVAPYNMRCDGRSDDAARLNAAIVAAAASRVSRTVRIPFVGIGVCVVGSPIILANDVTLEGSARSITIKRMTGVSMDAVIFSAPVARADGYLKGSFVPYVRKLSLAALTGAQPYVFDSSVKNNWYNSGQVIQNLTVDANGSDGTSYSVANVMFDGAANFSILHVTLTNLAHEGQSLSIWNSAYFAVDDVLSEAVCQGPTVLGASYEFSMKNIRTVGYWDSGAAAIAGPVAGTKTPNYAPTAGTWENVSTDGSETVFGHVGGAVGFDSAAAIYQHYDNFQLAHSKVHGLDVHVNLGTGGGGWISPAAYIYANNIKVSGNVGPYGGIYVDGASEVYCTDCVADNDGQYGVYVEGDEVSDGRGGYVNANASGIQFVNIHASGNAQYGAIVSSQRTAHGTVATVKHVEFDRGSLTDLTGSQEWGLIIAQPPGVGTVDYISSLYVTRSPNSAGTVSWDGIAHHTFEPS